ncbi:MAG TPA: hypothetical protein VM888_08315, partial [Chitinophagaceae bacterium]|nr:hypothetical protein [Chitinophagaceae bacterium]
DVAIINWHTTSSFSYENIIKELNSKKIILFDLNPIEFGLPLFFPNYQIQAFTNQVFLAAPSLHTLASTIVEKKNFWAALKQLFGL